MPEYLETTVDKFTFRVAADRSYSQEGVWLQDLGGDRVRVGVTDFVQQHGGDVAFATVRAIGTRLAAGDEFAELETVKVNLALTLPIAATILEINPALDVSPELVNQDPYAAGWLAVIAPRAWESEQGALLAPSAYLVLVQAQARQEVDRT